MPELSFEEKLILDLLSNSENGELPYKELNNACSEHFEGARLILKKLKEKGLVQYDGIIPGFNSIIKIIKPGMSNVKDPTWLTKSEDIGPLTEEALYILQILKENGGSMDYKELNRIFSEKYEGLRLILKNLKKGGYVDYDGGVIPSFSSTIKLLG
ncbi:MAG: hypothetical protein ACTSWN_15415 [Promethearchaeota archaeon]